MWLCLFSGRQFEDTFENAQWRKDKQMQPTWLCILLYISALRKHLKIHSGEKPNKCNQCDFVPSQAGHLRAHLKTHSLLKCLWEFSFSSISCQKLPFVAKSCQKLTNVANCCCKKILFLIGYYLLRANDQGKMSRGQNILAQKTKCCRTECHPTIQFLLKIKKCTFAPEVIVFRRPNTNIIRPSENDRIRIRIIFGLPKMTEYEYE